MPESLDAVPLEHWRDPASVFDAIALDAEHCFWLDAGPDALAGWSWVGTGVVEEHSERVRAIPLTSTAEPPWPAGRFRGGWVGWLGYEDAAERAGAPVSVGDRGVPLERWLRAERFVAFDHERRQAWVVAPPTELAGFAASISTDAARAPVSDGGARAPRP